MRGRDPGSRLGDVARPCVDVAPGRVSNLSRARAPYRSRLSLLTRVSLRGELSEGRTGRGRRPSRPDHCRAVELIEGAASSSKSGKVRAARSVDMSEFAHLFPLCARRRTADRCFAGRCSAGRNTSRASSGRSNDVRRSRVPPDPSPDADRSWVRGRSVLPRSSSGKSKGNVLSSPGSSSEAVALAPVPARVDPDSRASGTTPPAECGFETTTGGATQRSRMLEPPGRRVRAVRQDRRCREPRRAGVRRGDRGEHFGRERPGWSSP